jgi:hypothetical protein
MECSGERGASGKKKDVVHGARLPDFEAEWLSQHPDT